MGTSKGFWRILEYLKPYLEVLAVLTAATELAAETLVDVAPAFV